MLVLWRIEATMRIGREGVLCAGLGLGILSGAVDSTAVDPAPSLLRSHLLVTYYGNPHSARMGILGRLTGTARARALRDQADAYAALTSKRVLPAYHLVAVVAQKGGGSDGRYRRRESAAVIAQLLDEARANGFHLVLDVQPGRAELAGELAWLRAFLAEPDVHLALDPEFDMLHGQVPGQVLGRMPAADINLASGFLSSLVRTRNLPPKVLIVHQFAVRMLPDVQSIETAPMVDLVLDMDGFGSQSLKLSSYRTVIRKWRGDFVGIKLFYTIDTNLFSPGQVMTLQPVPAVVIYQ
jgi:hypothetical protein